MLINSLKGVVVSVLFSFSLSLLASQQNNWRTTPMNTSSSDSQFLVNSSSRYSIMQVNSNQTNTERIDRLSQLHEQPNEHHIISQPDPAPATYHHYVVLPDSFPDKGKQKVDEKDLTIPVGSFQDSKLNYSAVPKNQTIPLQEFQRDDLESSAVPVPSIVVQPSSFDCESSDEDADDEEANEKYNIEASEEMALLYYGGTNDTSLNTSSSDEDEGSSSTTQTQIVPAPVFVSAYTIIAQSLPLNPRVKQIILNFTQYQQWSTESKLLAVGVGCLIPVVGIAELSIVGQDYIGEKVNAYVAKHYPNKLALQPLNNQ